MTLVVVVWLLVAIQLPLSSGNPCPNATGCNGCGTSLISCQGASLTEFPSISAEQAALVEELELSGNFLTAISASDLLYYPRLVKLEVLSNDISYIEEGSFANNVNLSIIDLGSNPLRCDCGLAWIVDYLTSLSPMVDVGTCAAPADLEGHALSTLSRSQLICECSMECGGNSSCNLSTGTCECNAGYSGSNCSEVCLQGMYGLHCRGVCICEAGNCHHVTGQCTCFPDYYGVNCTHDCTGAPDCAALDREPCSLSTPEHSCGVCHTQRDGGGMEEWGNSSCVASVEVYSTTTLHSTAFYSTATLHSTASVTVEQVITATNTPETHNSLTKTQLIIIWACPLFVLLLALNVIVITSIILCRKCTLGNKVGPLPSAEEIHV